MLPVTRGVWLSVNHGLRLEVQKRIAGYDAMKAQTKVLRPITKALVMWKSTPRTANTTNAGFPKASASGKVHSNPITNQERAMQMPERLPTRCANQLDP